MTKMYENQQKARKALIIGVLIKDESLDVLQKDLEELTRLLQTLGITTVKSFIQSRDTQSARTLIGSGKVEEIRQAAI
ncbi:MAG: hypothetical protein H3C47_15030, partial [Candidatus Cloacimonetes bacterium]|nr:hypothetical protein [Candidatus Cloacimonadota bacterium]